MRRLDCFYILKVLGLFALKALHGCLCKWRCTYSWNLPDVWLVCCCFLARSSLIHWHISCLLRRSSSFSRGDWFLLLVAFYGVCLFCFRLHPGVILDYVMVRAPLLTPQGGMLTHAGPIRSSAQTLCDDLARSRRGEGRKKIIRADKPFEILSFWNFELVPKRQSSNLIFERSRRVVV